MLPFWLGLVAYYHFKRNRFVFQVMNFSEQAVASYIAFVGILSVLAQVGEQHSLVILEG